MKNSKDTKYLDYNNCVGQFLFSCQIDKFGFKESAAFNEPFKTINLEICKGPSFK